MRSRTIRLSRLTIRQRLFLAATLWIGGLILAAGLIIPTLVDNYLRENTKTQLQLVVDEIAGNLTVDTQGKLTLQRGVSDPRYNRPYSGYYWSVTARNDNLRSRSLWDQDIQPLHENNKRLAGANNEQLIHISQTITIPELRHPLSITVGIDEDPIEESLNGLLQWTSAILLTLFSGLMVFTFFQINWSLRPLFRMQKELKALEQGEEKQLSGEYPGEIKPLVTDLNALLFHYQELLERARNHAGNLSHSLKTPLSVLKNQIDDLPEHEKRELSQSVSQLQDQIDYHLSRARMAGSMNILSAKSNPSKRVDAIAMAFDKVYSEKELVLINELDNDLYVAVEQTDLDEMLGNLVENSYKWATSLIRVYGEPEGSVFRIVVEDDGKGIEQDKLGEIVKRGVRLDESEPGSGLGLSIVAEMAHSYRGNLCFERSGMGGLKAILELNLSR